MSELMRNKKLMAFAVVILVAILGAIVFAVGNDEKKPVATNPVKQVQQSKPETSSATTDQSNDGQTLGESTSVDSASTDTTSDVSYRVAVAKPASVTQPVTTPAQPQNPVTENQGGNTGGSGGGTVVTDPAQDVLTIDLCPSDTELAPIEIPVNAIFEGELQTCDGTIISWQPIYKNMPWAGDVPESTLASAYMIMNPEDKVSSTLRFVIVANDNPEYAVVPGDVLEFSLYMPELNQAFSFRVVFTEAVNL